MNILTYNTRLLGTEEASQALHEVLVLHRDIVNWCSPRVKDFKSFGITAVHEECYHAARDTFPTAKSQLICKAQQEIAANYKTAKANRHKLTGPIEKKNLSMRFDKRLSSKFSKESIRLSTSEGCFNFKLQQYQKLSELFDLYETCDPLVFERNGELWISISFQVPEIKRSKTLALGVDLGKRNLVATSQGVIISGKEYNKHKRRIRYNKRMAQQARSASGKRKLKKLKRKERRFSKNYMNHVANKVLETKADVIALENLKGLKRKKHPGQNKNNISQMPFYELRMILEYKALLLNKEVTVIDPRFTSQQDYRGKKNGVRRGHEYQTVDGLIFHADLNAANNIAIKSKLPALLVDPVNSFTGINPSGGQGAVNHPIVDTVTLYSRGKVTTSHRL